MRLVRLAILFAAFAISSLSGQNSASADGSQIQLGGYCPVAYVKMEKAIYGDPKFASTVDGKTFYFANEGAKKMFDADPKMFTSKVKYDSWCATGIAMGKKIATDPNIFSIVDGSIYLFSSQDAKAAFDKDAKMMSKNADAEWKKLAK